MKKITALLVAVLCMFTFNTAFADSAITRIKDIAKVQGVRSNQLVGYGIVVGLNGTGDSNKTLETLQSVTNMLRSFGVTINQSSLKTKNVAAVMVTATLPPFVREGDTIDITVSSMGDAKSIQGGTLIQTPLQAGNGQVYAVAQGAVSTGGFTAGNGGNTRQKNFPTVGTTPNGAIVEKTVEDDLGTNGTLSLSLAQPDFTTAARIAQAINLRFGSVAKAANPGRIDITVPPYYRGNVVGFIAGLEELPVMPDKIAKVVVNERTGTIVMGGDVSVDSIAVTQGGISISVTTEEDANQPAPFSYGSTIVTKNQDVDVTEDNANTIVLPATADVADIVGALNAVGATPRDVISILQAIKASGALHADLEII
ncbi:MAG: flagellar basal body P-ring protein FlgI [Schwartzia succinivorans]|jgi:flagellar P-ring protein precursor FlgI|uniref:flagellar basal body P-ring protein FlgI n=1 Tax=Schwartzia succinivorans TaxID=55507 RepID=UPI0023527BB5|nr:flagellar basal body P-ring protein FlgI [Schwartzia succinivorans]MBE6097979.1 flagellar basal body P-ring protein FlgI [Schwartzia succinivorans]